MNFLEHDKLVNPAVLVTELHKINSEIVLTTYGTHLVVQYPNSVTVQQVTDIITAHVYVSPEQLEAEWIIQIRQEFQSATTIAQLKAVLAKIFRKIYKRLD